MNIDPVHVQLPPSPEPSPTKNTTTAVQSVTQFTAESFNNLPGADELATRLNKLIENMPASLGTEDIAQMCHNFTSAFNLDNVLVEQDSQLKAIQLLLTITNCYDQDSIKTFADHKLKETPETHDTCKALQDNANKDNTATIVLPPEYDDESPNLSFWRERLMNSFIDCEFPATNFSEEQKKQLQDALRMAKLQIAANTGIGNFKEPIVYEHLDRETVSELAGHLAFPRQPLCADKLAKEIMVLQQQLFNSESDLIHMLGSDKTITALLLGNEQYHLKTLLACQGEDDSATLTNEVALLVSFASREFDLAGEFTQLGINPESLTHLAKGHSILNHARASENKQLTNEIAADGLQKSDEFTRTFFSSQTAREPIYKDEATSAKIALWLVQPD